MLVPGASVRFFAPNALLTMICVGGGPDSETGGEEGKVPLRRHEYGSTGHATSQTEEEGWQDGLNWDLWTTHDDDGLCSQIVVVGG